ncbi:ATP-binding protein [Streptomyces sp. V4I2]|uniref:ATP-binding protein n=1 Tax=Streptomyces sp. V4I2 TaxID=3042280 RepID=UPI00278B57F8|nr:ATP-binding protein [Streptomyces sp. V4I2]MDQ1049015.1 anti-sigma regulatory factor (Ser/Thr protein kinase) [Streptomyces sp. V4I2]
MDAQVSTGSTSFDTTPTQVVQPGRIGWDASFLDPYHPVAEARHRSRVWLQQHWKLPDLADSVELAVGELCANATRHGDGLARLELILGPRRHFAPRVLRVMVIDHAPDRAPELPRDNDLFSERGRGLRMVESLAWRWGWHRMGFDEKQVWCTFVIEPGWERSGLSSGF